MNEYRKIYEQHYGPIPKEQDGRSYEIHHIDGNHSNDSPENLMAVTIQEHYDIHYSQEDWGACYAMAIRMKQSSEEISELATENNLKRVTAGTHNFLGPENNNRRVLNGTHPFLSGEMQKRVQTQKVTDGNHHLLGPNNNRKMLEKGTHSSQIKKFCVYCNKEYDLLNYTNWHGNKCKLKGKQL